VNTQLELCLRLVLNCLFNVIIYNQNDPSLVDEDLLNPKFQIEATCFLSVKLSLELSNVPIRKILFIFYLFLRFLFGEVYPTQKDRKNTKYGNELI